MAGQSRIASADVDSDAFRRGLLAAIENFVVDSEEALYKKALQVDNAAKRYAPVDTGLFRASYSVRRGVDEKGRYIAVQNTAGYGAELEFGTQRTQAQPSLRPAIAEVFGIQGLPVRVYFVARPDDDGTR